MQDRSMLNIAARKVGKKLKKQERRRQILLELKLRPHVRISTLAERFDVSPETLRRDLDALAAENLIDRAHGGASAPSQGLYPPLNERIAGRVHERERIAAVAAQSVHDGETVMIDSGSTTIELAKALAFRSVTCTVITNSLPVAMTLGHGAADVMLCPGEYQSAESAVIGTETLEFLRNYHVDRCMIGASALSEEGISETVRGFAAVKREMLRRAATCALLIDSEKFGITGLASAGKLDELDVLFTDARPRTGLLAALRAAQVDIVVAEAAS
ncbi:DeoR/GlpR family DNA-binding transcription regulator [Marivita hallyeonensis]|uniref:Transcriptional regulator, DeoR family n=1 Tax=Marivita hallyeonensis TaxID=996342 RepID=A0A1M5RW46_9RHOB|nr:DeoR/GlpR family DNA-binding transcription regulator [Marivita hallyeonensis]SHH30547.1 transcriptional regulator, DeoR family [Marivita hallyeonensis]